MSNTEEELTPEQLQHLVLFRIEQNLRSRIALQVESKFHDQYHDESHVIANFIRNMA